MYRINFGTARISPAERAVMTQKTNCLGRFCPYIRVNPVSIFDKPLELTAPGSSYVINVTIAVRHVYFNSKLLLILLTISL